MKEAIETFKSLAFDIFPPKHERMTFLGQALDLLQYWLRDAQYSSEQLETTLQDAFGESQRLVDMPRSMNSMAHVALTASRVDRKGRLGLFSNYHYQANSQNKGSYDLITPGTPDQEPFLWEV